MKSYKRVHNEYYKNSKDKLKDCEKQCPSKNTQTNFCLFKIMLLFHNENTYIVSISKNVKIS